MRENKFKNFRKDVRLGLSVEALSQRYDLPLPEIEKGIAYVNRSWQKRLYTGFKQLFRNIIFEVRIKSKILKIQRLLSK